MGGSALLERMLEAAPVGIIALDGVGRVLRGNGRAWSALGTDGRSLRGEPLVAQFPEAGRARLERCLAAAHGAGDPSAVIERAAGDEVRWLEIHAVALELETDEPGSLVLVED